MHRIYFAMILCLFFFAHLHAGDDKINVLGYYAVNNSLDGQPMVDMVNVLRFYPVFAMRDSVDCVNVTVYYGGNIFERNADRLDDRKYWQVLLPIFRLGEAIQRIEVEVHFKLDRLFRYKYATVFSLLAIMKRLDTLKGVQANQKTLLSMSVRVKTSELQEKGKQVEKLRHKIDSLRTTLEFLIANGKNVFFERQGKRPFAQTFNELNQRFLSFKISPNEADNLRIKFDADTSLYQHIRDSLVSKVGDPLLTRQMLDSLILTRSNLLRIYLLEYSEFKKRVDSLQNVRLRNESLREEIEREAEALLTDVNRIQEDLIRAKDTLATLNINYEAEQQTLSVLIDSAKSKLASEIEAGLTDTMYSGPSIRKSDIVIDSTFAGARILYRNYKQALRHLMALDPAERLGIFRVRYVPFPITAVPNNPKTSLRGPFGSDFTVFEVGLAFGDAIVSGDDFVSPQLAWNRLGVAFAITEKLFSDSAQVIAVALTYDFNSYGSIGVGGNFAQHQVNPYVSFGINKKAFEAVLEGLAGLFK